MFGSGEVVEVDLAKGEVVLQVGEVAEGEPWTFDPPDSAIHYQHAAHFTAQETLLVSTLEYGGSWQVAREFELEPATRTLHQVWSYRSPEWTSRDTGEVFDVEGGHRLVNFGSAATVQEITLDGEVVFEAAWDNPTGFRPFGRTALIPDLYALNQGISHP